VSEIAFGDDDRAASVLVQPMNDTGPQRITALRERLAAAEKRVDERPGKIPRSGMDSHAGGLVDDDEVIVFVKHVERDGFGFRFERSARLRLHSDAFAAFEFLARFGGLAVDENKAGIDEFLDAGAGKFGGVCGDKTVEARAGVIGGCQKLDGSGRHAGIVSGERK